MYTNIECNVRDRVPARANLVPTVTPWSRKNRPAPDIDPSASAPVPSEPTSPRAEADWFDRFRPAPAPWDVHAAALIDWFESHRDALPREPFKLFPFVSVTDPPTFYIALARDVRAGPNGPRTVGLIHELQRLREMF